MKTLSIILVLNSVSVTDEKPIYCFGLSNEIRDNYEEFTKDFKNRFWTH